MGGMLVGVHCNRESHISQMDRPDACIKRPYVGSIVIVSLTRVSFLYAAVTVSFGVYS